VQTVEPLTASVPFAQRRQGISGLSEYLCEGQSSQAVALLAEDLPAGQYVQEEPFPPEYLFGRHGEHSLGDVVRKKVSATDPGGQFLHLSPVPREYWFSGHFVQGWSNEEVKSRMEV
jgi:hypothetical protein